MSTTRRRIAQFRRYSARVNRVHKTLKITSVRNGPYRVQPQPDGVDALFFEGAETVVKNSAGETVLSDKAFDFVLDRVSYGRILGAHPVPLSGRQRVKLVR